MIPQNLLFARAGHKFIEFKFGWVRVWVYFRPKMSLSLVFSIGCEFGVWFFFSKCVWVFFFRVFMWIYFSNEWFDISLARPCPHHHMFFFFWMICWWQKCFHERCINTKANQDRIIRCHFFTPWCTADVTSASTILLCI